MRDDVALPESALHWRVVVGAVLLVAGVVAMPAGLFGRASSSPRYVLGAGIFGVLLGAALPARCWAGRSSPVTGLRLPPGLRRGRGDGRAERPAQPAAHRGHRLGADDRPHPGDDDGRASAPSAKASIDKTIDRGLRRRLRRLQRRRRSRSRRSVDQRHRRRCPAWPDRAPGTRFAGSQVDGEPRLRDGRRPGRPSGRRSRSTSSQGSLADLGATRWHARRAARRTSTNLRVGSTVEAPSAGRQRPPTGVVGIYRVRQRARSPSRVARRPSTAIGVRSEPDSMAFVVREPGADRGALCGRHRAGGRRPADGDVKDQASSPPSSASRSTSCST